MKIYIIIIISFLLLLLSLSSFYLLDFKKDHFYAVTEKEIQWETKEKEQISRFSSVPILLYHDIDGKGDYSLTQEKLRSQFQFIKENHIKVIRLKDLITRLSSPDPFNERVLVISFDDGFLSMYTKLLPLVKEFNYPITLFIYTNNIFTKANNNITWDQLKKMEEYGIEVECHSMSHIDLEKLSAEDSPEIRKKMFNEIYMSKRILELYLDKKINYFAFPYGRYNLQLIELCRLADYDRIFSTAYRKHIITRDNYCIGRGHIKNNYSLDTIKQLIE